MENDTRFLRPKWLWIAFGLPILIVAWLAFRPEKLWINQRVNEPAPFASRSEARPIFAGRLEGIAHPTSGLATIYESLGGKRYLRLADFTTSNGPDVHVVLARAEDPALDQKIVKGNLDYVEFGKLKGNQGNQNYDVPAAVDLQKYNAVVIYCERFNAVFGVAREESTSGLAHKVEPKSPRSYEFEKCPAWVPVWTKRTGKRRSV